MDTIDNMRAFLAVVRAGSFSAAARNLDTVPSVISKKVNRLEDQVGAPLFIRSTRKLELTETGAQVHPRFLAIVAEVTDAFADLRAHGSPVAGSLRIKCPTTLCVLHFGRIVTEFQAAHPGVRIDLVLMDRSVNPMEEGFDIAIGAIPSSYPNVEAIPLCPYPRSTVASPGYLERAGELTHPQHLLNHDCLTFHPIGSNWIFEGAQGPVSVEINSHFSVNDSQVLVEAALADLGVAVVADYLARPHVARGTLCRVLEEYAIPELWISAWVPVSRSKDRLVMAMCDWLREAVQPVAPWDRGTVEGGGAADASAAPLLTSR
ncbi:LysR family transcriptional regulator [Yangia mangrovi]|uniref:LysR family transcriptional regulator n=1 Tax=Alloyangia mangrovi TaxID=1779329 RepID=A0ABT2KGI0_9RHOB|nr:LysR family transcriptional regulator [Alloyangia mangrovi]MCA0942643.1 LysR family transcriptional regulator [Alloyangia pacifica]MCA0946352.1 LysR family transcriptional regulator [Alloyangia pacifica]MCT4368818.1 LysR family transcriptional regulator [Alloyangia mangrovi]